MDTTEERRKAMMEGDFNPGYSRTAMPSAEQQFLNAADYAAFQLGRISRDLAKLVALLEKKSS